MTNTKKALLYFVKFAALIIICIQYGWGATALAAAASMAACCFEMERGKIQVRRYRKLLDETTAIDKKTIEMLSNSLKAATGAMIKAEKRISGWG